jgi:F-type H+-transporting ATPase subunit alpha
MEIAGIRDFRARLLEYFAKERPDIIGQLDKSKDLSEDIKEAIIDSAKAFKAGEQNSVNEE